jgi:hypothetical protein
VLGDLYQATGGPNQGVNIIGAGMAIVGSMVIRWETHARSVRPNPASSSDPNGEPLGS